MNPFELRYAILHTAKEVMEAQYKANLAVWESFDKTSKASVDLAPKFPTLEEIIEKAVEMNKFVSETTEKELIKTVKNLKGIGAAF
jgi:hypothetical protein